jgi:hypothetical protein
MYIYIYAGYTPIIHRLLATYDSWDEHPTYLQTIQVPPQNILLNLVPIYTGWWF